MIWKEPTESIFDVSERMTWDSECGNYRVVQSHIPFGFGKYRGELHLGYTDRVYAMHLEDGHWNVVSTHRSFKRATLACEKHSRKPVVKKTGRRRGKIRRGHEKLFN